MERPQEGLADRGHAIPNEHSTRSPERINDLRDAGGRHQPQDERLSLLQQEAGRRADGITDDGTPAWIGYAGVDTSEIERKAVRHAHVATYTRPDHGVIGNSLVEVTPGGVPTFGKTHVVVPFADHPAARRRGRRPFRKPPLEYIETIGSRGEERHLERRQGAVEGMDVRIDEAGREHASPDIDDLPSTGGRADDVAITADGCDHAAFDAHTGRSWV